jgi:cytochrome c oxidase assembly protein subunit 15
VLACALCLLTLCLLFVGAMVTSTGSGLAVPDWPTTFGRNMFAFPLSGMKGGIFYEHGHRLFASAVGLLTVILAAAVWIWETRTWVKALAGTALALVIAQGILGGVTVRHQLPVAVSSAHAGLAQIFFCSTVWLAWAVSPSWKSAPAWIPNARALWAIGLWGLCLVQSMAGAVMRHSHASFAIPTFPAAFGSWAPPFWNRGIALNYAHTRVGAILLAVAVTILAVSMFRKPRLLRPAMVLAAALDLQILLGMLTVWSGRIPWVASLHLACGGLLLGALFTAALWSGKNPYGRR